MELSKKNHGHVKSTFKTNGEGKTVLVEAFGKDDSDVTGSASKERGGKFGGSMTNLSHSLTGTSANQEGS